MASYSSQEALDILRNGKYSDYEIVCGEHVFKVNKVIVAGKSQFFRGCVDGSFQESEEGRVAVDAKSPFTVAMFLIYLYSGGLEPSVVKDVYPKIQEDKTDTDDGIHFKIKEVVKLYVLADEWMVEDLKKRINVWLLTSRFAGFTFESGRHTTFGPKLQKQLLQTLKLVYDHVAEGDKLRADVTVFAACFWSGPNGTLAPSAQELWDLMTEHEPGIFRALELCIKL